jgi:hypothetical protein
VSQCTATAKSTGERCERDAISGGDVCIMHGGKAPQVRAAARRRLVRERLAAGVAALLDDVSEDLAESHPGELILEAAHRAAGMARLLEQLVGMLAAEPEARPADATTKRLASLYGPNHLGDGAPHVLLDLLGEWTDRQAKLSKLVLDADIDERLMQFQAAVAEMHADRLVIIVGRAIRRLGLEDRAAEIGRVLAEEIRGVDVDGVDPGESQRAVELFRQPAPLPPPEHAPTFQRDVDPVPEWALSHPEVADTLAEPDAVEVVEPEPDPEMVQPDAVAPVDEAKPSRRRPQRIPGLPSVAGPRGGFGA